MHFTYASIQDGSDLQQGDLLHRTAALENVIREYHPYYSEKEDYTHFLVLTQSCDLVRRNGKPCDCPYISLGAVRPLKVAIEREIAAYRQNRILSQSKALNSRHRGLVENFMMRLFNNNEKEYFYLHEDPKFSIYSSCAFLRLSISIRAHDHYSTCMAARIATLSNDFRAKLGWLVGNIFSRVGTDDWSPAEIKRLVNKTLEENIVWLDDLKLKEIKLEDNQLNAMTADQIIQAVNSVNAPSRKEKVIGAVLDELKDLGLIGEDNAEQATKVLKQSQTLAALVKN